MMPAIAKRVVGGVIKSLGPRRMLNAIRHADPRLVGPYVASDYPKHLHDPAFVSALKAARADTLVDELRQHELWSLVQQAGKLAPGDILEVGVWRGGTGLILGKAMAHFGVGGQLFLADTFSGVVKAGANDNLYVGGEHADTSAAHVQGLLERNGVIGARLLVGIFPEDTADQIPGSLRMVHIDVDVQQSARDIVDWTISRLVPGGLIVFDDYGAASCAGVTRLCEEYETDQRFTFLHNWNGHCVLIKRA